MEEHRSLEDWTLEDVAGLLRDLQLHAHEPQFRARRVNGRVLLQLAAEPALFAELGVTSRIDQIHIQNALKDAADARRHQPQQHQPPPHSSSLVPSSLEALLSTAAPAAVAAAAPLLPAPRDDAWIDALPARTRLYAGKDGQAALLLDNKFLFRGPRVAARTGPTSTSLHAILMIDRTGSMAGNKMTLVKEVLMRVVPALLDVGFTVWFAPWALGPSTPVRLVPPSDDIDNYLRHIFDTMTPYGRTDLYGSFFQVCEWARTNLANEAGRVFLLTDGEHNCISRPVQPCVPDDPTGLYALGRWQFVDRSWQERPNQVTEVEAIRAACQKQLARTNITSVRLIGIAEANMAELKAFATALGPGAEAVGVTNVGLADLVFDPQREGGVSCEGLLVDDGTTVSAALQLTTDDMLRTRAARHITICQGVDQVAVLDLVPFSDHELLIRLQQALSEMQTELRLRAGCLGAAPAADTRALLAAALANRSRLHGVMRSAVFRDPPVLRDLVGIWAAELGQMASNQIQAFVLAFEHAVDVQTLVESGLPIQMSETARKRFETNLQNSGLSGKHVIKLVEDVRRARDRGFALFKDMFLDTPVSSSVNRISGGVSGPCRVQLEVSVGTHRAVAVIDDWAAYRPFLTPAAGPPCLICFESIRAECIGCRQCVSALMHEECAASFRAFNAGAAPCPLCRRADTMGPRAALGEVPPASWFDSGDIVPAMVVQLVGTPKVMVHDSGACWIDLRRMAGAPAFVDLTELWRERQVEQAVPGDRLRMLADLEGEPTGNAVMALGHTSALYLKFRARGRFFTSAINITGSLPAYVPLGAFYAQVFACGIQSASSSSHASDHMLLAMRALGTFFHAMSDATSELNPKTFRAFLTNAATPVLSRQDAPGPLCHEALAAILSLPDLTLQQSCWTLLVATIFGRYAEALAGHKSQNTDPAVTTQVRAALRHLLDQSSSGGSLETLDGCLSLARQHTDSVLRCLLAMAGHMTSLQGMPPFPGVCTMLSRALHLGRHFGMARLAEAFERGQDHTVVHGLIQELLRLPDVPAGPCLPLVRRLDDGLLFVTSAMVGEEDDNGETQTESLFSGSGEDFSGALARMLHAVHLAGVRPLVEKKIRAPAPPPSSANVPRAETTVVAPAPRVPDASSRRLPHVNVAFLGDRDAGKSTAIGRLLVATGAVAESEFNRFSEQVAPTHREASSYAWLLDHHAERMRGITITSKHREFSTPNRHIAVIDNSGHQRYIRNVAAGASQADAAVFVVSAVDFCNGAERSRGNHVHALLAFVLGVKQLVVLINKMDEVAFEQARFEEACEFMRAQMAKLGHKDDALTTFIPVSALHGENVAAASQRMPWYTGPTLVEALDVLAPSPSAAVDMPFRLPVDQVHRVRKPATGEDGVVACGTVHYGEVRPGDKVLVAPSGRVATVHSIQVFGSAVPRAGPGDDVGILLRGVELADLESGSMLGSCAAPPAVARCITARVQLFRSEAFALKVGSEVHITCHTASRQCRIIAIRWVKQAGEGTEAAAAAAAPNAASTLEPPAVRAGDLCEVTLMPLMGQRLAVERFATFPSLGRFAVLINRNLVGCGLVLNPES